MRAAVDRTYGAGPLAHVSWPDPHPEHEVADEEYSRVTDPERYRIVGARADAWVETLTSLGLAAAASVPVPTGWRTSADAATLLRPHAPGAQPLLLVLSDLDAVPGCVLTLGAGEPPVAVGHGAPDCGCDACDSGSEDLLRALDDEILAVVGGGFVHIEAADWSLQTTVDGWSATGLGAHPTAHVDDLIARARAGDEVGHRLLLGAAW
ncbi:DUF6226 family protein [Pseudactinotalea suaedae]|nr:DUF6226 family protein [Pseudactinotalea suaedae]